MPSICLIGNSHVANLKLAWPEVEPEFPGYSLVFFAVDGLAMEVEVSHGKLAAPNPRIRERMALTSQTDGDIEPVYNAYVVCGLGLSSIRAMKTVRETVAQLKALKKIVTAEDIALGMERSIRGSIAVGVISKLRQLTNSPIFMIATPLAAYERHTELWDNLRARGRETLIAEVYELACNKVAQEYHTVFVSQPAATTGPIALTTRPEFYRLPPEEVRAERAVHTHMNTAFGAIVLRDVLYRIRALLA